MKGHIFRICSDDSPIPDGRKKGVECSLKRAMFCLLLKRVEDIARLCIGKAIWLY